MSGEISANKRIKEFSTSNFTLSQIWQNILSETETGFFLVLRSFATINVISSRSFERCTSRRTKLTWGKQNWGKGAQRISLLGFKFLKSSQYFFQKVSFSCQGSTVLLFEGKQTSPKWKSKYKNLRWYELNVIDTVLLTIPTYVSRMTVSGLADELQ